MSYQTQLKSLTITGSQNLFKRIAIEKIYFQLQELEINNMDFTPGRNLFDPYQVYDFIGIFLMKHVNTLEKFVINKVEGFDFSSIMDRFTRLQVFDEKKTAEESAPWECDTISPSFNFKLIDKNIEELQLVEPPRTDIEYISTLLNLKSLMILRAHISLLHSKSLIKLKLKNCEGLNRQFFLRHRRVEELHVEIDAIDNNTIHDIATCMRKLKTLKVRARLDAKAFEIIAMNCKSLKFLDITHDKHESTDEEWGILTTIEELNFNIRSFKEI